MKRIRRRATLSSASCTWESIEYVSLRSFNPSKLTKVQDLNQDADLEAADQAEVPPAREAAGDSHPRPPISLRNFAVVIALVFVLVQLSNVILGVIIKVARTK